jgi:hypothetical protein
MSNVSDDGIVTVQYLIDCFKAMDEALQASFGISGKPVLIAQKSPKQMTVTKVK